MTTPSPVDVAQLVSYFGPDQTRNAALVVATETGNDKVTRATLVVFADSGQSYVLSGQPAASWSDTPSGAHEFQGGWSTSATPPAEPGATPAKKS